MVTKNVKTHYYMYIFFERYAITYLIYVNINCIRVGIKKLYLLFFLFTVVIGLHTKFILISRYYIE